MTEEVKNHLITLAQKYETKEFLEKDPSQFMHRYKEKADQETAAFIAANLSFGRRDQILSHVEMIFEACGDSPYEWILSEKYNSFFFKGDESFYRMFSHNQMKMFCNGIFNLIKDRNTLGEVFKNQISENLKSSELNSENLKYPFQIIAENFPKKCIVIPHGKDSAAKKLNMFLRWMVRDNSPVDLGLWSDWFDKKNLLMPLDTHVMQQATVLNLIEKSSTGKIKSAGLKTAVQLTEVLKQVFPEDPVKADFALFGYGVEFD